MRVLLTNDDGINAPGIRALYKALKKAGHLVYAVAPMRQQSGVGHSLTVFEPLRAENIKDADFEGTGIYGTPTDCVKLALGQLVKPEPDLVMAGINIGSNVGPDIFYSGTIGAAAEAAHGKIPSMAISHGDYTGSTNLEDIAEHAVHLAEMIDWKKIAKGKVVNINYPPCTLRECRGARICHQSPAMWKNKYEQRFTPGGRPYWWLCGEMDMDSIIDDTDERLLKENFITITPLKFEMTDEESVGQLRDMKLETEII